MPRPFSGEGHSRQPLSEDEVARIRHMFERVEAAWPQITNLNLALQGLAVIGRGIKLGGPIILAAGGLGAYLKFIGAI